MDLLLQDIRHGIRGLVREPGFAAVAILTLALGMGATTAMFGVVRGVLLAPLPYSDADSRVMVWSRWTGWDKTWVSPIEVQDYRQRVRSFRGVAAWESGQVNLTGGVQPERVGVGRVTANTFEVLGARPLHGRGFQRGEDASGTGARAVVLSHGLWQRRFGGDQGVLGRTMQIDGASYQIVGIMPKGFKLPTDFHEDFAEPTELWTPLVLEVDPNERGNHGYYAAAQLAPRVTAAQASAELFALGESLTRAGLYAPAMRFRPFAVSLVDEVVAPIRPALALLVAATVFLLLIACANVANLLLARAEQRRREIALRTALGAGRWRMLRQLVVETLLICSVGGVLAVLLAWGGMRLVAASNLAGIPRAGDVRLDGFVLGFAAILTIVTSLVCASAPALRAADAPLTDALKDGAQNATAGSGRQRLRNALVVAEMALAVVLLISAGLALRSLWALQQVSLGFEPRGVLTMRLALPEASYESNARVEAFYRELIDRVRRVPGVQAAGAVRSLPLANTIGDWGLDVEGYVETPENNAKGDWQVSTDGAFEALGERLIAGRSFTAADRADAAQVAIVNEKMASLYWKDGNPIGRRIRMGSNGERPWATVVGIVADLQHNGLGSMVKEKFYRPHAQFAQSTGFAIRNMTLVVKTPGGPMTLVGAIRHEIAAMDPSLPVAAIRPMTDVVDSAGSAPRFTGWLLGLFAALALTLAAIGIYGVLAYLVSQRTREIGIRIAVGAAPASVLRLIVGRGLRLAFQGVVIGLVAAFIGTRVMVALLYQVQPRDLLTFVAVPLVLSLVALLASVIPAVRAMRVDPINALRTD
jgi:putative ABC transport system permease protein